MNKCVFAVLTCLAVGCFNADPIDRSDVGLDVSNLTQDVVHSETVCGLPQLCSPWTCFLVGSSWTCQDNSENADLGCLIECGSINAECPLIFPQTACHHRCDPLADGSASGDVLQSACMVDCVNAAQVPCQLGVER